MALLLFAMLLPVLLLVLMLAMEHVERPLRQAAVTDQIEAFLDQAGPEDVEEFVRQGFGPALESYWRRRRFARLIPGRAR